MCKAIIDLTTSTKNQMRKIKKVKKEKKTKNHRQMKKVLTIFCTTRRKLILLCVHICNNCRQKSKPKAEWLTNKMKKEESHASIQEPSEATPTSITRPRMTTGWAGVHICLQFYQTDTMRIIILLDNQSTTSIFCNNLITKSKAMVKDFGEVWFDP